MKISKLANVSVSASSLCLSPAEAQSAQSILRGVTFGRRGLIIIRGRDAEKSYGSGVTGYASAGSLRVLPGVSHDPADSIFKRTVNLRELCASAGELANRQSGFRFSPFSIDLLLPCVI